MAKAHPFEIEFGHSAQGDLAFFDRKLRREIFENISVHLRYQPDQESHKIKRMRPNPRAEWELRLGDYRVLYDIVKAEFVVLVRVVGEKRGNKLFVRGEEFHDHESD